MTPLEIAARAAYDASGIKRLPVKDPFARDPMGQRFSYAAVRAALTALRGTASVGCCLRVARRLGLPPSEVDMAFNGVIDAILGEKP